MERTPAVYFKNRLRSQTSIDHVSKIKSSINIYLHLPNPY